MCYLTEYLLWGFDKQKNTGQTAYSFIIKKIKKENIYIPFHTSSFCFEIAISFKKKEVVFCCC